MGIEPLSSLIPKELTEVGEEFRPCVEAVDWIRDTFLSPESKLYNVEHDHLNSAEMGFLWTNAPNSRHGKRIVGTAELATPPPSLSKWGKARWIWQMKQWFGDHELDFLITLFAPYFAGVEVVEQCSGCEHEVFHCGHKPDALGFPAFSKDGRPKFGIRGHDVEEFTGIMKRYGPTAGAGDSLAFVMATRIEPEITLKDFAGMCGTCQ